MSHIGFPYAPHQHDARGAFLICPRCGERIDLAHGKDFESKSGREYASHFATAHAAPERRFIVVGLTEDGDELQRVTVVESKLDEAKQVFAGFADWVDVIELPSKDYT